MGELLNNFGLYRNGLKFIEEAGTFYNNDYEVLFQKAYALLNIGEINDSIETVLKLIKTSPNSFNGRHYLILLEAYLKINEIDEEIAFCINKILELGTPEVFYSTGNLLKKYKKKDYARNLYLLASDCNNCPKFYLKKNRYWIFWSKMRLYLLKIF